MFAINYLHMLALRLRKDDSGAVATEYAFLVAFIAIVAAIGMVILGTELRDFFTAIGTALGNAGTNLPTVSGT